LAVADVDRDTPRSQLASYLAPFVANVADSEADPGVAAGGTTLGLDNGVVDELVTELLRDIVASRPGLRRRALSLRQPMDPSGRRRVVSGIARTLDGALRAHPTIVDALWRLLAPSIATQPAPCVHPGGRRHRRGLIRGRHVAAGLMLTATIAGVVAIGAFAGAHELGPLGANELVVIWILSFLPGWLYIRFIGQRAEALWDEFVLNLHRLGLDEPQHLPQPPLNSVYYRNWFNGGGATLSGHRNIYRQKFDAFYGRSVSEATKDSPVNAGTFFPVVLATVAFALGWTTLFWSGTFLESSPDTTMDILAFGFLGAYLFDIQMLSRRFFQSDLRPSAYASAVLRVVIVLILVFVVHQLPLFDDGTRRQEAVVAFVIGLFPIVGLQALNRLVAVVLRSSLLPTLQSKYPLSDLDGLNVWYEARLLEEGIEDMQNLVSANMVDVLLHTRVPVGRLVDWHDQAQLYLHLRPATKSDQQHPRIALSSIGVRSATAFLKAFSHGRVDASGQTIDPLARELLASLSTQSPDLSAPAVMTIAKVLDDEPGLGPVWKWRTWEAANGPAGSGDADTSNVTPLKPTRTDDDPGDDDDRAA
jgi:hypothetical protein